MFCRSFTAEDAVKSIQTSRRSPRASNSRLQEVDFATVAFSSSYEMYPHMLQPREGKLEYRIVKHKFDAFFETDLDAILRYHQVDTVIITGTATNACCESTARSAFMRDYKVVFPSDLNATFDEAMHRATLKNIDLLFGRVVSSDELLAEMEAALETSRS
jgi:nicotinamidase-related amidase